MLALAAIPGLPKFSFLLLAAVTAFLAWRAPKACSHAASERSRRRSATRSRPQESLEDLLKLDELSLEVGLRAGAAGRRQQGGQLLARVKRCGSNLALQLGFIVPPVHITDNLTLEAARVCDLAARGGGRALGDARGPACWPSARRCAPPPLPGTPTREPAFGVSALWIARSAAEPGAGLGLCGGRSDFGAGHASGGGHQAARLTNC